MGYKFFLFCIVGFSGLLIDFSTTFLLKETLRVNKYLSTSIGFLIAATSNFYFNRKFTFNNASGDIFSQYLKFLVICLAGLLINNLIICLFNARLKYNFYLSKLFAVILVVSSNYLLSYYIVFPDR